MGPVLSSDFFSSETFLMFQMVQFSSVLQAESSGIAQLSEIPGTLEAGPWGQTFQNPT